MRSAGARSGCGHPAGWTGVCDAWRGMTPHARLPRRAARPMCAGCRAGASRCREPRAAGTRRAVQTPAGGGIKRPPARSWAGSAAPVFRRRAGCLRKACGRDVEPTFDEWATARHEHADHGFRPMPPGISRTRPPVSNTGAAATRSLRLQPIPCQRRLRDPARSRQPRGDQTVVAPAGCGVLPRTPAGRGAAAGAARSGTADTRARALPAPAATGPAARADAGSGWHATWLQTLRRTTARHVHAGMERASARQPI